MVSPKKDCTSSSCLLGMGALVSHEHFFYLYLLLIILLDRCSQYQNLPQECTLVADDRDPICCKVPKCNIPSTFLNKTGILPLPTAAPGIISGGSVTQVPTPGTTLAPVPGQPNPTPNPTPVPRGRL